MPRSTGYFKKETISYIVENYSKNSKILDVGPGIGTYSDLLKPEGFTNIDCVEAFEKYIIDYNLTDKYTNVFLGSITNSDIDFDDYDLIIFGDVLEHIELSDAKKLLKKLDGKDVIVAIPFESEQDESFGNKYEIHLQADLTFSNFFERYNNFHPLCLRFDYGVFVTKNTEKNIYIEIDENPLKEYQEKYIKGFFPDYNIININSSVIEKTDVVKNSLTIVTGLWNIGRDNISDSFKKKYDDYREKFSDLLKTDVNMYIFIDPSDEEFVWKYRNKENTIINTMSLNDIKEWFNFTDITNEIRKDEDWLSQASWLRESPQATLELYNPIVMSKMFMLNNVTIWNPFNSEYFFWIDAGITNTVSYGYFTHDKVFNNLPDFINTNNDFVFLTYPYIGGEEIHGFERGAIARYCKTDYVEYVCRGGFFGGKKRRINEINGLYYSYLNSSLAEGFMGTEESVFTIIMHNHQNLITQYTLEQDGLVWPFFENLKDKKYTDRVLKRKDTKRTNKSVGLYVLTYNSPKQFETLCKSFAYDQNFLDKTTKFLLNNSTDRSLDKEYAKVCKKYGFTEIKKNNIGICGGRQFVAEHSEDKGFDYSMFFEDDMFFYNGKDDVCRNGFSRHIEDLYNKVVDIAEDEQLDFLKFNFSEFFGDNSKQWSWHNVPQDARERLFPERPNKTENDTGKEPFLKFSNIKIYRGTPYATGEVFYCNWPQIVSREGNKKMFLDTTWAHPFEQTWMSHIYQETVKGNIKSGVLLATPTEHDRFEFYPKEERREN